MLFCIFTAFYRKLERDCNLIKTIWIAIFEDTSSDIFAERINLLIKMSMHSVLILGVWIVFGYWQWKGKSKAGFWIGVKCFIPTIKSDNGHWAGGHPKIWAVRPWFMVIKFFVADLRNPRWRPSPSPPPWTGSGWEGASQGTSSRCSSTPRSTKPEPEPLVAWLGP